MTRDARRPISSSHQHSPKQRSSSNGANMSSDADYQSFLDQANQDVGGGTASTRTTAAFATTRAVNTNVPEPLSKIKRFYTSDADEPFEPVSLKWSGKQMPSESELLINPNPPSPFLPPPLPSPHLAPSPLALSYQICLLLR